MCIRALFSKSAITHGLVEQAFWRVPLYTKWVIASSFDVILAWPSRQSTTGTFSSGTSGSRRISLILLQRIRRWIWWCNFSTLIDIPAETAIVSVRTLPVELPLPTLQEFFVHAVLSLDSWPRRSSHSFRFWIPDSWFVDSARYFISPSFSTCENQVLVFSDESPGRKVRMWFWFLRLVFLICTILPRCHPVEFSSMIMKFRPT